MEEYFRSGQLTVIAGRPGAGKTTLLRTLLARSGLRAVTDGAEERMQEKSEVAVREGLPAEEDLGKWKDLAAKRTIPTAVTVTLNRRYLRKGALCLDAVKRDMGKADILLIVDRPPDIAAGYNTLLVSILDGREQVTLCRL